MKPANREGARGIQSIEVSGRILRALVEACQPMMLKDLALAAELAPAQCHAYLTSLRHVGLVHQDLASGLYSTGAFALRLGIGWMNSSPQSAAALAELRKISDEMGVMSLISIWAEFGPTIIHMNPGTTQTALNLRPGSLFSVTGSATGRVFASFGHTEEVEQRIAAEINPLDTSRSIGLRLARAEFEEQVTRVRACGYSIADSVPIPGINAVAAPIFDASGALTMVATLIASPDELPVTAGTAGIKRLLVATKAISQVASPEEVAVPYDN